jgi:integrase
LDSYLNHKLEPTGSITGNRFIDVKKQSVKGYKYRINSFYRWVLVHKKLQIEQELAYPKPRVIRKEETTIEERCERRVDALLNNEIICTNRKSDRHLTQEELKKKYSELVLDDKNLEILNNFKNYKITSSKVESYTGFVSKIYFLKRLGIHLKCKNRTYTEATREDIQDFLDEVQKGIKTKKELNGNSNSNGNGKIKISSSYKAHLLDFYRFIYRMFEEEQPRKYPDVVSWLYQKRKKSHDTIPKEIIPDKEIKLMIEKCTEERDRALISLIADSSGRVGEIININIGDVKISEVKREANARYTHLIATVVLRGKTGERTNQLFNSVPHLRLWLLNHPLKDNPTAPLFIATKECRYGQRISPVGVNKILQRASRRAGITRHIHAHLFRHTNLTKMARLLSESELKIHAGWGTDSKMASVYVHLSEKDVANKILQKYGLVPKDETQEENILQKQICQNTFCSWGENPAEAKFCLKCGWPLTLQTALSLTKIKKKEEELQTAILNKGIEGIDTSKTKDIREAMYLILKNDKALIERLKEIITLADEIKGVKNE